MLGNKILKEYLLRGYSINKRLNNIEQRINNDLPKHEQRIGQIEEKNRFLCPYRPSTRRRYLF